MKPIMTELKGKADRSEINQVVQKLCQQKSVEMIRAGAEVGKNIKHAIRHLMSASQ